MTETNPFINDEIESLPSPRFILVHSHDSTLDAHALDRRAHAFGPFDDYDDLVVFDAQTATDSCYRFAIPIIGPEQRDMELTAKGLRLGARPGAMPLPPRSKDETQESPIVTLLKATYAEMQRREKDRRKAAKKAEKAKKRAIDKANAADDGR